MADLVPNKWDTRFMRMAFEVSTWSKDPSTKIGAVAEIDRHIVATGYNGLPRGVADTDARLEDRPTKYRMTVHAEQNVICDCARRGVPLLGASIHVFGIPPCNRCAVDLIQVGVKRVCLNRTNIDENIQRLGEGDRNGWIADWEYSQEMFKEAGVEVCIFQFEGIHTLS
jgi:dCMP deaminase